MISWFNKKHSNFSPSMAEVEYIEAFSTSCEAIWFWNMMSNLLDMDLDTIVILCDNRSCIKMT